MKGKVLVGILTGYPLEVCVIARDIKPDKIVVLPLPGKEIMDGIVEGRLQELAGKNKWAMEIRPQVKVIDFLKGETTFQDDLKSLTEEFKGSDLNISVPHDLFVAWEIFKIAPSSAILWTVEFLPETEEVKGIATGPGISTIMGQRAPAPWRTEGSGYTFRKMRYASNFDMEVMPKLLPNKGRAVKL